MKRHVFGTFLIGATITWLVAYALTLAGFADLALVVAGFFGAVTVVATITDYLDLKQRQEYDEQAEHHPELILDNVEVIGADLDEVPQEILDFIENVIKNEDVVGMPVIKITKMETVHMIDRPQTLSQEELDEIDEKFS